MDDLARKARRLGARVDAAWQPGEVEAQLGALHARLRRRRAATVVACGALVIAAVIAGGLWWRGSGVPSVRPAAPVLAIAPPAPPAPAPPVAPAPPAGPDTIALGDGSTIRPDGAASRLVTRGVSPTEVAIALEAGGARFEVPAQPARHFRVLAGSIVVATHGASFHVLRAGQRVEVAADRGELVVRWAHEQRLVAPGETATFPPPAAASMDELLAAADAARLSGAPADAAHALERALALHASDPRAPLAAFTLGRVQLEQLGAPREAAAAFARTQALAPAGPLAEDALAREVEAWSRAGEPQAARARAEAYLTRYPEGRRAHAVRQFGGLAPSP